MSAVDLQSVISGVISGAPASRVEALRQLLDYPVKQRDSEDSWSWFLRHGADENEPKDTCPKPLSISIREP